MPFLAFLAVQDTISDAQNAILEQVTTIKQLSDIASRHPYYKYNSMWTRDMQDAVSN
jgi:hypothetical protein